MHTRKYLNEDKKSRYCLLVLIIFVPIFMGYIYLVHSTLTDQSNRMIAKFCYISEPASKNLYLKFRAEGQGRYSSILIEKGEFCSNKIAIRKPPEFEGVQFLIEILEWNENIPKLKLKVFRDEDGSLVGVGDINQELTTLFFHLDETNVKLIEIKK